MRFPPDLLEPPEGCLYSVDLVYVKQTDDFELMHIYYTLEEVKLIISDKEEIELTNEIIYQCIEQAHNDMINKTIGMLNE